MATDPQTGSSLLVVTLSGVRGVESEYVVEVLLGRFLRCPVEFKHADGPPEIRIGHADRPGEIVVAAPFLDATRSDWLQPTSMPSVPLGCIHDDVLGVSSMPVLYGAPSCHHEPGLIRFGADLFGTAFFLLSGYEEHVRPNTDGLNRIIAEGGFLSGAEILDRPLVDEVVDLLRKALFQMWPDMFNDAPPRGQLNLTHDVDDLGFRGRRSIRYALLVLFYDVTKRRVPVRDIPRRFWDRVVRSLGRPEWNSQCRIQFLARADRRENGAAWFFFRADEFVSPRAPFDIEAPACQRLIRRLDRSGHHIGLHPSRPAFDDWGVAIVEATRLRNAASAMGVPLPHIRVRNHYLQWDEGFLSMLHEREGIVEDWTLGYPDRPGFRRGTCRRFPLFDLEARRLFGVDARPLAVMDVTLHSYMNLEAEQADALAIRLAKRAGSVGGDFTLLWHNNYLVTRSDRRRYVRLIRQLRRAMH